MMGIEPGNRKQNVDVEALDDAEDIDDEEDQEDDFDSADDNDDDTDNIGDVSVELNVEELIAEIEQAHDSDAARQREVRRRLEEIREQRDALKDIEDTFAMYLDDDE